MYRTSTEPFDVSLPQVNDNGMACELAMGFAAEKACPVFRVSNVTGEGLELLKVSRGSSSRVHFLPCCPDLRSMLCSPSSTWSDRLTRPRCFPLMPISSLRSQTFTVSPL